MLHLFGKAQHISVFGSTPSFAWLIHIQFIFRLNYSILSFFLFFFHARTAIVALCFPFFPFQSVVVSFFSVYCVATSFFVAICCLCRHRQHFILPHWNSTNEYTVLKANLTAITLNELNRTKQKESNQIKWIRKIWCESTMRKPMWKIFFASNKNNNRNNNLYTKALNIFHLRFESFRFSSLDPSNGVGVK